MKKPITKTVIADPKIFGASQVCNQDTLPRQIQTTIYIIFRKVDGLLFGISECSTAIQESQCAAIIIEATMNPRMIAKPIIEMCKTKNVPFLCMTDLRKLTLANFGIKTSCLGLKNECLPDVENEIKDISKIYSKPSKNQTLISCDIANMDVEENKVVKNHSNEMDTSESPYLYRNNKKTRIFVPNAQEISKKITKNFIGQDFIEFSDKVEQTDSKSYMKMILKRISNNADRVKKK